MKKGIFTISLDTELAWGVVDTPKNLMKNLKYYKKSREVIDKLLLLFQQYEISATWAVVGHLFLDTCKPVNGQKHPEILRSNYPRSKNDWFVWGVAITSVIPSFTAIFAISTDSSMLRAPSSSPGKIWQCVSTITMPH
ncbi:MAG: hypothetical protein GXZ07_10615 [Firmicutes bacterium]|nr:hypothetical protein [Bacillota bacterium]